MSSSVEGAVGRDAAVRFARRSELPMLFDLTTIVDSQGATLGATALIDLVRRGASPDCDIRVLAEGARAVTAELQELADHLRCDIYLAGADNELEDVGSDIVAFDRNTGQTREWSLIRPQDVRAESPTWFERKDGRLRVRSGVVTLPLVGGLAFANRRTFFDMAEFTGTTTVSANGITPVVVSIHSGQFCIAWYSGIEAVLSGADLARFLVASLEVIEPNVQIALPWPSDENEQDRVDRELQQLADALDRTVWVPERTCRAAGLASEGQLAAVDPSGQPARWVAYHPAQARVPIVDYDTDRRGVLVASGLSRPTQSPQPTQSTTANRVDMAGVNPDHRELMRRADAAFRALNFAVPDEATTLKRVVDAWADYLAEYETTAATAPGDVSDLPDLVDLRQQLGDVLSSAAVELDEVPMITGADRPTMERTPYPHPPHRLPWLPRSPIANAAPITLYHWLSTSPERVRVEGVCLTDPYLIAHSDPAGLARRRRSGFVLRLDAPRGSAVVASEYVERLPASMQHRAPEHPNAYVIPAAWLPRVRLSAWHGVDSTGALGPERQPEWSRLLVTFRGSDHGVIGLPNDAVRWPRRRKHATAFLTLPDDPDWIRARLRAFPGWLPLLRQRVNPASGYRILEVSVVRGAALDVTETLAALADVPIAHSSVAAFVGVDLLLPSRFFGSTVISSLRDPGTHDRRTSEHHLIGKSVADALPTGWRSS